jgi:hypothetical protein
MHAKCWTLSLSFPNPNSDADGGRDDCRNDLVRPTRSSQIVKAGC